MKFNLGQIFQKYLYLPYITNIMNKTILSLAVAFAACFCAVAQSQPDVLEEVISSRRSIRKYTDQKVEREVLDRIVKNGLLAPSGMNRQSYELRIIDDPQMLDAISRAANPSGKSIFLGATAVIFIANAESYDLAQVDCGLLAQNMMLSAQSLGLGTCCMGMPIRQMKETPACAPYLQKLAFSDGYHLLLAIALGYPAESPSARPRKSTMVKYVE